MKFARTPLFRYALALLGLIFGARKIVQDIHITDFPIDMVVYREGVKAFLEHRSVYSEPMLAGDSQLRFILSTLWRVGHGPLDGLRRY